jgi:heat shock protein HtpX
MAKRIFLFMVVNLLIVMTISIILAVFKVPQRIGQGYGGLMIFCLIWGMGGAFISLALSRVMAKWFMGVRLVDPRTSEPALQNLVTMVHELAQKARLPVMPQVGIYDSPEVNAFATGPSKSRSLVAVSTGLLQKMRRDEIEGVIGHEIAHIANGDMVTMTLLQGIINAFVMFLARILAFAVSQAMRSRDERGGGGYFMQYRLVMLFEMVFSLLGMLIVTKFSRWREFRADAGGARFAGKDSMINALQALRQLHLPAATEQKEAMAFQTLKISGKQSSFLHLFSTHPPIEERIARLQKL